MGKKDKGKAKDEDQQIADYHEEPPMYGFEGYIEDTLDPGPWLLLATCTFSFGMMLFVVPCLLWFYKKGRKRKNTGRREKLVGESDNATIATEREDSDDFSTVSSSSPTSNETSNQGSMIRRVTRFDTETKKILKLAIPYTLSALTSSVFSNTCLILVSQYIGVKPVAAYALVQVLVGLCDGVIQAPIYACTTLCSQAVGAGNHTLAGNYIQLSLIIYLAANVPVVIFWWFCKFGNKFFSFKELDPCISLPTRWVF